MKKLLQAAAFLTFMAFFLPVLTVGFAEKDGQTGELLEQSDTQALPLVSETELSLPISDETDSYDCTQTITLWYNEELREMTLREYLIGVVAAEMPAGFPEEALKAQTVAARSYALYKLSLYDGKAQEAHHGAQLCADSGHCEAFVDLAVQASQLWSEGAEVYAGRIADAVKQTDGWVLTWQQEPIAAVFCAASGAMTETAEDIWGAALPYLVSVDSPGGTECSRYYGQISIAQADFAAIVKENYPDAELSGSPEQWIGKVERSPAGSVLQLELGGVSLTGREMRSLLGLNSSNFTLRVQDDQLIFETEGYGHGVGMSQYGARYLALAGQNCEEILAHYYPGTLLERR